MMVRDLLPRLAELPPETELLVEMGGPEPNSVVVAGLDQPVAEDGVVSLRLDPADLLDALKDLRLHAERTLATREEPQSTPSLSLAGTRPKNRTERQR